MKFEMAMTTNVRRFLAAVRELNDRPIGVEGMGLLWGPSRRRQKYHDCLRHQHPERHLPAGQCLLDGDQPAPGADGGAGAALRAVPALPWWMHRCAA